MKIAIIGSGTWGTALSQVLIDNGHEVVIFGRNKEQVDDINNNHQNSFYFGKDIYLDERIKATTCLEKAVDDVETILLAVPSQAIREMLTKINSLLNKPVYFINTAKGFDIDTKKRLSLLISEVIPSEKIKGIVSLIGPSHAEEVIVRDVTCVCAVCENKEISMQFATIFSNSYFRVYGNNDVIGSEIGAAMKNSIAIASGTLEGLGYSDNARAALYSRGLAEMVRFGLALGGKLETFLGLTGAGDLAVTCYSFHSRNFTAGLEIGKADSAAAFLKNNKKTVEGIRTTKIIHEKSKEIGVELPIVNAIYAVLFENAKPSEIIQILMNRPIKIQ